MCSVNFEIRNLDPDCTTANLVGVVIAKSQPRIFDTPDGCQARGVMNITIRDELRSTINVIVWGSQSYIMSINTIFRIGDVMAIQKPKISIKRCDNDSCQPFTYSPFELTINEGQGLLHRCTGPQASGLTDLINKIFKPTTSAMMLNDVVSGPTKMIKPTIDLLVAVRHVHPIRNLSTKSGNRNLRQIAVMDESQTEVIFNIWEGEFVERAGNWTPMQTILHLVDVQAKYSTFYKRVILTMSRRTIVVENPNNSSRARSLRQFIENNSNPIQPFTQNPLDSAWKVDAKSITEVMTIQNILDKSAMHTQMEPDGDWQFTAVLYAIVTRMDLAPTHRFRPISKYCSICYKLIEQSNEICDVPKCVQSLTGSVGSRSVWRFHISIALSDHSDTLEHCHLDDKHADSFFGFNMTKFKTLTERELEEIRWKFLLDRFSFKIVVKCPFGENRQPYVSIVECKPFTEDDVAYLKTY